MASSSFSLVPLLTLLSSDTVGLPKQWISLHHSLGRQHSWTTWPPAPLLPKKHPNCSVVVLHTCRFPHPSWTHPVLPCWAEGGLCLLCY